MTMWQLRHANACYRDLLKQMRARDGGCGIDRNLGAEFRVRERSAEMCVGFPNCVIEIGRAVANGAVELGRDEARLPFHESGIVLPALQEALLVRSVERE